MHHKANKKRISSQVNRTSAHIHVCVVDTGCLDIVCELLKNLQT